MCSKPDVNVLIVGLDNAGKTVRTRVWRVASRLRGDHLVSQTLLEQIKGIYSKARPIAPARIPPTVGMNSCVRVCHAPCGYTVTSRDCARYFSWKDGY
jgi:hypothetical protein